MRNRLHSAKWNNFSKYIRYKPTDPSASNCLQQNYSRFQLDKLQKLLYLPIKVYKKNGEKILVRSPNVTRKFYATKYFQMPML